MSPPSASSSWALVPEHLFTEFLSLLPVKSLLRFKCVSNSWNTLISDPNFVKLHLKKSKSHNPQFTLITQHIKDIKGESPYGSDDESEVDHSIIPYSIHSFLDNPSFTLFADHHYLLNEKDCSFVAGSCNGLICLYGFRFSPTYTIHHQTHEYWLRLWNPATRAISEKIGCFIDYRDFCFNFGCDNSTGTFKAVASRYIPDKLTSDVRVFSFDENVWRNIQSFPVVPFNLSGSGEHEAVFFNGTLNWLAVRNDIPYTWYRHHPENLTVEQFVIVSLNLGTEIYNMYTLPQGFDEVPPAEPTVGVLGDCFCFSYSYKETDFIIWQMKKFGIQESWTQFLKISYHDLQLNYDFSNGTLKYYLYFLPLFLSKDGDTLILYSSQELKVILYNWRDHRVERTEVEVRKTIIDDETYNHSCWQNANGFVESLTSIC
ncbi:F-box/kelch-repeat protein At3g23880-like [Trifolium pratense]|uniref:F-box/kelch-repeat protein At3g23880-like n=1 Tax=Trifolium pratense TaxID=57577 RepID=UPI001E697FE9|nr:F-box/kelch-repeat protein At3g23880-like [Trifolium pratense]XP_045830239.1 F-box/kelch-repeat protein At3g23880-like [Trifolium pratense]XP_045830240.1 F-box/kelch-repeat protein At3g23880-like [Trifolium pratense]XP_045830241.1 F-box/kelch-repeat protein At3g23880-like [Trifolium pratense]XP_045830242.1 F-box/kelch-repeat protein At3g23880-like [Trifolium pratense]XP_045830243.1 F-box/kelch-repeat protein At3g23880-like [Trifolium pratense]